MVETGEPIRSEILAVPHGFFGRRLSGGGDGGAELNVQDDSQADRAIVEANRRRIADAVLPDAPLALVEQVHGIAVHVLNADDDPASMLKADAIVTRQTGVVLGIVTADCAPVLLADEQSGVIAAVHAGWRSAHHGVLESTLRYMEMLGATRDRIHAAIGPCIAQQSYEVGLDFRERFEDEGMKRFFTLGKPGKWQFDLPAYVGARLQSCRIAAIDDLAVDTYENPERFFSFRRALYEGSPTYLRQLSAIGLPVRS